MGRVFHERVEKRTAALLGEEAYTAALSGERENASQPRPEGREDYRQPTISAKSFSGLEVSFIPNCLTSVSRTPGDTKAGKLGPSLMFFMPR